MESREDFLFYTYPTEPLPKLEGYILLTPAAPVLSKEDAGKGLLLLDGTWRYAEKMLGRLDSATPLIQRSLPKEIQTAYPRRQDVEEGLASIEAIYAAYSILGRDCSGLLDLYHWKERFLELNASIFGGNG